MLFRSDWDDVRMYFGKVNIFKLIVTLWFCLATNLANAGDDPENSYIIGEKRCDFVYMKLTGPKVIDIKDPDDDHLVYEFYVELTATDPRKRINIMHPIIAKDLDSVDPVLRDKIDRIDPDGTVHPSMIPPKQIMPPFHLIPPRYTGTSFSPNTSGDKEYVLKFPAKNFLGGWIIPKYLKTSEYRLNEVSFRVQSGTKTICEMPLPDGIRVHVKNDP